MDRFQALAIAFGLQEYTQEEIASLTRCSVQDIASAPIPSYNSLVTSGWFSFRTCDLDWCLEKLFPNNQGLLNYWLGVISAVECTAKLNELDTYLKKRNISMPVLRN